MVRPDNEYDQLVKAQVRERVLQHAITCLTDQREESAIVSSARFHFLFDYCARILERFGAEVSRATFQEIADYWEALQQSRCGERNRHELMVLYLCGPRPMNDLDVLMREGIPPQNVWAIESDPAAFRSAVEEFRKNNIPARLYKGSLREFFEIVPQQFDLVYYDACSPLFGGKPKSNLILKELFLNQRLSPLSVLITNFSEPNADRDQFTELLAAWYAPRFDEPVESRLELVEREDCRERYLKHIETHFHDYYSDFTTRFTAEFAGQLIAWWRTIALSGARDMYFSGHGERSRAIASSTSISEGSTANIGNIVDRLGHVLLARDLYPLLWTSHVACELPGTAPLKDFFGDKIGKSSLASAVETISLLRQFAEASGNWAKHNRDVCSVEMANLLDQFRWFDSPGEPLYRVFCDTPYPNVLVDLLVGTIGYPYQLNVSKVQRFDYTAKTNQMYTDVFVFDQCRYFYDFAPTLPLFSAKLGDAHQLILRICIDLLGRHAYALRNDLFHGAHLASRGEVPQMNPSFHDRDSISPE